MSTTPNSQTAATSRPSVSPARRKFSLGLLIVMLVVLAIEARSGLGVMLSGKALQARATDGAFDKLPFSEAQSLVAAFPEITVYADHPDETIYRYSWLSLLRTLAKKPAPELFIVASKADPPMAVAYFTDASEASRMFPTPDESDGENGEGSGVSAAAGAEPAAEKPAPETASEKAADTERTAEPGSEKSDGR